MEVLPGIGVVTAAMDPTEVTAGACGCSPATRAGGPASSSARSGARTGSSSRPSPRTSSRPRRRIVVARARAQGRAVRHPRPHAARPVGELSAAAANACALSRPAGEGNGARDAQRGGRPARPSRHVDGQHRPLGAPGAVLARSGPPAGRGPGRPRGPRGRARAPRRRPAPTTGAPSARRRSGRPAARRRGSRPRWRSRLKPRRALGLEVDRRVQRRRPPTAKQTATTWGAAPRASAVARRATRPAREALPRRRWDPPLRQRGADRPHEPGADPSAAAVTSSARAPWAARTRSASTPASA